MNNLTKLLFGFGALAIAVLAVAYPEYQRRRTAYYACAQHSKAKLSELRSSGDKFYAENNFFFADKGALGAEPDETRGYRAIVAYDIGYTPERLVLSCYVSGGVVSNFEILGKAVL